jgi:transposase
MDGLGATTTLHGARAVVRVIEHKVGADPWLKSIMTRRNKNIAAVALANKNVCGIVENPKLLRFATTFERRPSTIAQAFTTCWQNRSDRGRNTLNPS